MNGTEMAEQQTQAASLATHLPIILRRRRMLQMLVAACWVRHSWASFARAAATATE